MPSLNFLALYLIYKSIFYIVRNKVGEHEYCPRGLYEEWQVGSRVVRTDVRTVSVAQG